MTATDGPVEPKKVLASGKLKTCSEEGENGYMDTGEAGGDLGHVRM